MPDTYTLSLATHLNTRDSCYEKIITVDREPNGPLSQHIKRLNPPPLSPFEVNTSCSTPCRCVYAIKSFVDSSRLLPPHEIPQLYSFLQSNGYSIDIAVSQMTMQSEVRFANPLICFITF